MPHTQHPIPALTSLLETYHSLNLSTITTLTSTPSPLEFMRYVAQNTPFVIRGGASDWSAVQKWNVGYLKGIMGEGKVQVAITPFGNADAVVKREEDGKEYFVKPLEVEESFQDFVNYIQDQDIRGDRDSDVKYAQTQNDNLRNEYAELFKDVEKDISWARIALGSEQMLDAVNLWIGNSRSVTALHRDNYENIYVQIIGEKRFVLLSPVEVGCVGEKLFPSASYTNPGSHCKNEATPNDEPKTPLIIVPEPDSEPVPFATWDPDQPPPHNHPLASLARPVRVTLKPGDMLYLPSLWYHKVSQTCGKEGICVAVNYWYDMEYRGFFYPASSFIRNVAIAAAQEYEASP